MFTRAPYNAKCSSTVREAGFGEEVGEGVPEAGKRIFPHAILSALSGTFIKEGFQGYLKGHGARKTGWKNPARGGRRCGGRGYGTGRGT